MKTIAVDALALREVLQALVGPPHLIRELQALMTPREAFPDNPINKLIDQFNEQATKGT